MPDLPFIILGIEHVGIAVRDLNKISEYFGDILGIFLLKTNILGDLDVLCDFHNFL